MRIVINPDLDVTVAAMIVEPVNVLALQVLAAAAVAAPPGKEWVTVEDERVRRSHVRAHGQECPANVPFILHAPGDDGSNIDAPGTKKELAMAPRDPQLSPANRYNCRCESVPLPGAVARSLQVDPAAVTGTTVHAQVWTEYPRAGESEAAEVDGGWLLGAARDVAAAHRE